MVFTGTYEHTIDAKSRMAIPSEIRAVLGAGEGPVYWYVTLGEDHCLALYTQEGFERRAEELEQSELEPEELLDYERVFFSLAQRVEMDKNGRIRLPEQLLRMTDVGSEVVLIGVKDRLEIRNRQAWYEHLQKVLENKPDRVMNPRRAMKRGRTEKSEKESEG